MNTESAQQMIKDFIQNELSYGLGDGFTVDTDLIEQGVIDSMSLLRLVTFLEEQFGIEVRDEDLVPENFRSLTAINAFIDRSGGVKH
jgi:acyl carrier protein